MALGWPVFLGFLFLITFIADSSAQDTCRPRKFGWNCAFKCECNQRAACDSQTGACPKGCKKGTYGLGCLLSDSKYYDSIGKTYQGRQSTAATKTCLNWDDPWVKKTNSFTPDSFPDQRMPKNYCRNPRSPSGSHYRQPWCFTNRTRDNSWTFCNLQESDCPDKRFGDGCILECHCNTKDEVCHKKLGHCLSGCSPGWLDPNCQRACDPGWYGQGCTSQTMGQCKMDIVDPITGKCVEKCKPGYKGDRCTEPCNKGSYGENCVKMCGECRDNFCDAETGICENEMCRPGYDPPMCNAMCPDDRYGHRCRELCGYCKGYQPCNKVTGHCSAGCSSGYNGTYCKQSCPLGTYGENCALVCGHCENGKPCDQSTGQCLGGCSNGYGGAQCIQALRTSTNAATVGGVATAIIVFCIVAAFLACFLRRRRYTRKANITIEPPIQHNEGQQFPDNSAETDKLIAADEVEGQTSLELHPRAVGQTVVEIPQTEVPDGDAASGIVEEPLYVNVNTKKQTSPVKIEDLYTYIESNRENTSAGFKKEHEQLPHGIMAMCDVARKPDNKTKNRYGNIIAYDHSRVVLEPTSTDSNSDYVNANYMDGYNRPKAFIASQGPNKAMVKDFWRMVWQQKACKIVMLTNLLEACKKKCEQYWPNEGVMTYGEMTVVLLSVDQYTNFIVRSFKVSRAGSPNGRIVKQFHFITWSDHGAPTYATTLLAFRRKVQMFNPDNTAPVIVHCSAGIGRTGTYIALEYLLQQAKQEEIVDVLGFAQLMRTNRVDMIQTWQQYAFVYDALLEAIKAGETTEPCSSFRVAYQNLCTADAENQQTPLEKQFEALQLLSPTLERDECKAAMTTENLHKNRFKNILPANRCRPFLYTEVPDSNDFINAVFLPGFKKRDSFLVTQMPLPDTVGDFWRMLYDYNSDTVVMLNDFDRNDQSCALYWPEEYGYTVEFGPLTVELLSSSSTDPHVTMRNFKLRHSIKDEERAVKQFQFKSWSENQNVPTSTTAMLRLYHMANEWIQQIENGPTTVHCMNGATRSGLFCAVSLMFERMKNDNEVDVFQTVKTIRANRPQLIEDMEQYQFLYQMALEYLDTQ